MENIFIGIGSSIGNVKDIFDSAQKFLEANTITILGKSNILKNPPMGGVAKNEFSNAVWQIGFNKSSVDLLNILQDCENYHGRVRNKKWDDRTLDLDILMFENQIVNTQELIIPHPEIPYRNFVLLPWLELVDESFQIPTLGTLKNLIANLDEYRSLYPTNS